MADKKISQLPSSTTPLAGTELVPVVQSGVTKQVSVANLTAGRTVNASEIVVTSSTDAYPILVDVTAGSTAGIEFKDPTTTTKPVIGSRGNNLAVEAGGNEVIRFGSNGNITVNTGNLVIGTAGKGIDFSADGQAAGMTSELLDDYEEGTWTATLTPASGSITLDISNMTYTRIGRQVTVAGRLRVGSVSSPSGLLTLGDLPFTVKNDVSGISATTLNAISLVTPSIAMVSAEFWFGTNTLINFSIDSNQIQAGSYLVIGGSYFV